MCPYYISTSCNATLTLVGFPLGLVRLTFGVPFVSVIDAFLMSGEYLAKSILTDSSISLE